MLSFNIYYIMRTSTSGDEGNRLSLPIYKMTTNSHRLVQNELAKKGVNPIMRSLELGDALWVAKCHDANFLSRLGAEGDEVVLDYIVERKRLDDLISSVKDGRFHEQKFRLKRSGIKNVVYIVEEISMDADVLDKRAEMVQSAIASTQFSLSSKHARLIGAGGPAKNRSRPPHGQCRECAPTLY